MIKQFVTIGSGKPFAGQLPSSVNLPVSEVADDGTVFTFIKTSKEGDIDWEESLFRWMFLNGYCYPEDNAREMR